MKLISLPRLVIRLLATSLTCLTLCAQALNPAFAQQPVSLLGKWQHIDQSVTVNIAECKNSIDLCAIIIEEVLAPGEPSAVGAIVVKDIRKTSSALWRGKYLDGKTEMDAQIILKSDDVVDFKVCALLFVCDTQTYKRLN